MYPFPYTNTHELNLDWILNVVKDFQSKYNGISDELQEALDAIEQAKTGSLSDIASALSNALLAVQAEKANVLQDIATERNTALSMIQAAEQGITAAETAALANIADRESAAISSISDEKGDAISAIAGAETAALSDLAAALTASLAAMADRAGIIRGRLEELYNTLPQNATDILGQLAIIDGILNGNSVQTLTWLQGQYVGNSTTIDGNTTYVTSQMLGGAAGRRIKIDLDNAYIITDVGTWKTINGVLTHGGFTIPNPNHFDNTFPMDTEYFSIEIMKADVGPLTPSDIPANITIQWPTTAVQVSPMFAYGESNSTASIAHIVGTESEFFTLDGYLYRAIANIPQYGSIVISGNGQNAKAILCLDIFPELYNIAHQIKPLMTTFVDGWNLLDNAEYTEQMMISNAGVMSANTVWFLAKIPVESGKTYYLYTENTDNHDIRRVCLFNASDVFQSCTDYPTSIIPAADGYMIMMLRYTDDISIKPYAYATTKPANERVLKIPDLIVEQRQIENRYLLTEQRRVCAISFQFDDCDDNDAQIVSVFDAKKARCGFAFIASSSNRTNKGATYLGYQAKGYEILSHSTDGAVMNAVTPDMTMQYADQRIRDSYYYLTNMGFNIRGWVTPNSEMAAEFIPLLVPWYDYATTVYYYYGSTASDGSTTPYQDKTKSLMKLHRMSLENSTLAELKAIVDDAITNRAFLTFYGHSANLGNGDFTTENIAALIDYIQSKEANYTCHLLKPCDAVDYYFHVRHSDYLEVLQE